MITWIFTQGGDWVYSVTARAKMVKQPRGGYARVADFLTHSFDDGYELCEQENVHASIVGMAVDYLTRYQMGASASDAFQISLAGAERAERLCGQKGSIKKARKLLSNITGLDNRSIISACKLASFDVWIRNYKDAYCAKGADQIEPDSDTIYNIETMVCRCLDFWELYGPIVLDGFTFEPYGYTNLVSSGDGDFLTYDTLWDFKVSKSKPTSKQTLQLLMYWIMGQHSGNPAFSSVEFIGIFNPRLNMAYTLDTLIIPQETISIIEQEVIGYDGADIY